MFVFDVSWIIRNDFRLKNKPSSVIRDLIMLHFDLRVPFRYLHGFASSAHDREVLHFLGIPSYSVRPIHVVQVYSIPLV